MASRLIPDQIESGRVRGILSGLESTRLCELVWRHCSLVTELIEPQYEVLLAMCVYTTGKGKSSMVASSLLHVLEILDYPLRFFDKLLGWQARSRHIQP